MYQESGIYHIYNRGCNRENIFFQERKYKYLIQKFEETIPGFNVEMIAYCFMPNHYHLLVRQITEKPLSKWLRQVFNGYSQAINKQENRSGTLFQGRPKHILIDSEQYLVDIIGYIHYNPVVAGLVKTPEEWAFSNCQEWYGMRSTTLISEEFIQAFLSRADYVEFMEHYSEIQQEKLLEKLGLEGM